MTEKSELGDYRIIKEIGRGTLGSVYLAEHRFMKKQFALKMLPSELSADRSFIQRFEEGVGLLASLEHPHIVKIHNVSFDQGQYFLVTDCIVDAMGETTNLGQYLANRKQPFAENELWQLLNQLASALDYAHGKKIAHLGVKLQNVLVSQANDRTNLYLSDYGLSKIIGAAEVLTRIYKRTAEAIGIEEVVTDSYGQPTADSQKLSALHDSFLQSYLFLAPEQKRYAQNALEKPAFCDVYAFGVLAYYVMLKQFPEGVFPMPSETFRNYRWNWDSLVRSCLQRDPANRPASLLAALEQVKSTVVPRKKNIPSVVREEPRELVAAAVAQEKIHRAENGDHLVRPVIRTGSIDRPQHDPNPETAFHVDTTVKHYTPESQEVSDIQPLLTEMVVVQGDTFLRGSNDGSRDEVPRHKITLKSFAIDVHPVSNEQFVRFLELMGGEKDNNHLDMIRLKESRIKRRGGKFLIESGYVKHPVVGVTWYGAVAYAKWVGKRLPTEGEWEIAARGGLEEALYPTGEDIEKTQANFFNVDTTAVKSYPPNEYGLYDIAGNIYEWCHDWYGYNYYETSMQEPENPKGPLQGVYRVLRGGCWKSLKEDLRCSRRHRNNPGTVNGTYGFRCAADVE